MGQCMHVNSRSPAAFSSSSAWVLLKVLTSLPSASSMRKLMVASGSSRRIIGDHRALGRIDAAIQPGFLCGRVPVFLQPDRARPSPACSCTVCRRRFRRYRRKPWARWRSTLRGAKMCALLSAMTVVLVLMQHSQVVEDPERAAVRGDTTRSVPLTFRS